MAGHLGEHINIYHRLIDMPNETPPAGSTIHFEVIDVSRMDDGDVEVVMRYLDHD